MGKRLKVLTLGCKANFADSASVVRLAAAEGYEVVPPVSPADVVIINTCTVTHRADRDSRSLARKARRENPCSTVILAGCYAQMSLPERDKIPEVDHWVGSFPWESQGNGEGTLAGILRGVSGNRAGTAVGLSDYGADLLLGHRRTFLKIQDGCDSSCAYCVVPLARGRSRSVPEEEVIARAVGAEADGARELVLTGIPYRTVRGRFSEKRRAGRARRATPAGDFPCAHPAQLYRTRRAYPAAHRYDRGRASRVRSPSRSPAERVRPDACEDAAAIWMCRLRKSRLRSGITDSRAFPGDRRHRRIPGGNGRGLQGNRFVSCGLSSDLYACLSLLGTTRDRERTLPRRRISR